MYPEEKTFSISSSVILEKFAIKKVEPFKESSEEMEQIKKELEVLSESQQKVEDSMKVPFLFGKLPSFAFFSRANSFTHLNAKPSLFE